MAVGDCSVNGDRLFGCLLISSPQGRSGKTIVTIGLCDAFKRKGLSVQPFKKGPDYIDPSWLTAATGRNCRNLDLFLIPENRLLSAFGQACQGAHLAIIEGAMGLYDGMDSVDHGTTAEIARLLGAPVILVVNASRMTGSIAAMISGYQHFQEDIHIGGVILNHVSGPRHESKLRNAVEKYCKIPVVGSIPRDLDLHIAERHLGLIPSPEWNETESYVERIGRRLEGYLDVDHILTISRQAKIDVKTHPTHFDREIGKARIAVIRDRAFHFYYPENLEALTRAGAELVFINSLQDRLPTPMDGLYIGGGFPEFFLNELEGNRGLRQDIACAIEDDLPTYAECAGLMYLCRRISWQGRSYEMVGTIPAEVQLSQSPQGHGYVVAEVVKENPLFPIGLTVRGHEFHHSSLFHLNGVNLAYSIKRGHGMDGKADGVTYKNLFASYTHLHALGTPEWAECFMSLVLKKKKD